MFPDCPVSFPKAPHLASVSCALDAIAPSLLANDANVSMSRPSFLPNVLGCGNVEVTTTSMPKESQHPRTIPFVVSMLPRDFQRSVPLYQVFKSFDADEKLLVARSLGLMLAHLHGDGCNAEGRQQTSSSVVPSESQDDGQPSQQATMVSSAHLSLGEWAHELFKSADKASSVEEGRIYLWHNRVDTLWHTRPCLGSSTAHSLSGGAWEPFISYLRERRMRAVDDLLMEESLPPWLVEQV